MGYRIPRKVLRIEFDGTDYDGAEVVLSLNASVRSYLEFQEDRSKMTDRALLEFIGERLVEWNLEDDEGPLPADVDGVLRLDDVSFVMALFEQWQKALVREVEPSPLSPGLSSNGAISESLT